jgi:HEAT repeat protein
MRTCLLVLALTSVTVQAAPRRGRTKPPKIDVAAVAVTLAGTDTDAAIAAANQLGEAADPAAHEALLDALAFGMSPPVAVAALGALTLHPAPVDVSSIGRYAHHRNPTVRGAALSALATYPGPAHAIVIAGLHDRAMMVRNAAEAAVGKGRIRSAVEPMLQLLAKGEEGAARGLAQLADPDLARTIADRYGKVPDATLALALGSILQRTDFGPDTARVELVHAIAKIQDPVATDQLSAYVKATPANPPRPSRQEAKMVIDARSGGGQ